MSNILRLLRDRMLEPIDRAPIAAHRRGPFAPILAIGVPRSGTTILYRCLVSAPRCGSFSNIGRRKARPPALSACLHRSAERCRARLENHIGASARVAAGPRAEARPEGVASER